MTGAINRGPSYSLGSRHKVLISQSEIPGPGTYVVKSPTGPAGRRFAPPREWKITKNETSRNSINRIKSQSQGSLSNSSTTLKMNHKNTNSSQSKSGQNTDDNLKKSKSSIIKTSKKPLLAKSVLKDISSLNTQVPGPGAYNPESLFGYIPATPLRSRHSLTEAREAELGILLKKAIPSNKNINTTSQPVILHGNMRRYAMNWSPEAINRESDGIKMAIINDQDQKNNRTRSVKCICCGSETDASKGHCIHCNSLVFHPSYNSLATMDPKGLGQYRNTKKDNIEVIRQRNRGQSERLSRHEETQTILKSSLLEMTGYNLHQHKNIPDSTNLENFKTKNGKEITKKMLRNNALLDHFVYRKQNKINKKILERVNIRADDINALTENGINADSTNIRNHVRLSSNNRDSNFRFSCTHGFRKIISTEESLSKWKNELFSKSLISPTDIVDMDPDNTDKSINWNNNKNDVYNSNEINNHNVNTENNLYTNTNIKSLKNNISLIKELSQPDFNELENEFSSDSEYCETLDKDAILVSEETCAALTFLDQLQQELCNSIDPKCCETDGLDCKSPKNNKFDKFKSQLDIESEPKLVQKESTVISQESVIPYELSSNEQQNHEEDISPINQGYSYSYKNKQEHSSITNKKRDDSKTYQSSKNNRDKSLNGVKINSENSTLQDEEDLRFW